MKVSGRRLAVLLAPFLAVGAVTYGCSSQDRPGPGGAGGVNQPGDNRCSVEGQTRSCYELVSVHSGVRSCFQGLQTCKAGAWGACGGSGTITATNHGIGVSGLVDPTDEQIEQIKIRTHPGSGSPEAGACANPCDPGCVGYDEDASITPESGIPEAGAPGLPATPPGFVSKLLLGKGQGYGADCERWETGNNETGHVHSACQSDYFCSRHASGGTNGSCVQFTEGPNETHAGKLAGSTNGGVECADAFPDLTLGTPCLVGSDIMVTVCNRGAAAVASGTTIRVAEENATAVTPNAPVMAQVPEAGAEMAACPTFTSDCSITLSAPLNPGFCVKINGTTGCTSPLNGNKSLYVNSDKGVRECVIQPKVLGPPVSAHGPTVEQNRQFGCANNWTAFNASQVPACPVAFVPLQLIVPYRPTCGTGETIQWGKLAWNASLPAGTSFMFEVRTRDRFDDGGAGAWGPWVTVGDSTAGDPAVCPMAGPTPCPKDLFAPLGGLPTARYEDLDLRISLNPNGAGTVAPTLNSYQLAYSCVGAE